jgi:hypothetical protein
VTAENHPPQLQKNTASPVPQAPRVVLKPQETAAVVSTNEKRKARPE